MSPTDEDTGARKKTILLAAVIVITFTAAGVLFAYQFLGRAGNMPTGRAYYYDLDTGELFVAASHESMAAVTPSKNRQADGSESGVLARVFSCGKCSDKSSRVTAYVETYTADARQANAIMAKMEGGGGGDVVVPPGSNLGDLTARVTAGHVVAKPTRPVQWLASGSNEAAELTASVSSMCSGQPAVECYP